MAKTPEGAVKDEVKKRLAHYDVHPFMDAAMGKCRCVVGAYFMPVAGPFSVHGVHDFVGVWNGRFFSIETKAPDNPEDATLHQEMFRAAVSMAGGVAMTGVRSAAAVDRLYEICVHGADVLDKEPA